MEYSGNHFWVNMNRFGLYAKDWICNPMQVGHCQCPQFWAQWINGLTHSIIFLHTVLLKSCPLSLAFFLSFNGVEWISQALHSNCFIVLWVFHSSFLKVVYVFSSPSGILPILHEFQDIIIHHSEVHMWLWTNALMRMLISTAKGILSLIYVDALCISHIRCTPNGVFLPLNLFWLNHQVNPKRTAEFHPILLIFIVYGDLWKDGTIPNAAH